MTKFSFDNGYGTTYTFEVVDKIPSGQGYVVWNIDFDKMYGFIPFCQLVAGTCNIVKETLKAVYMPDEDVRNLIKREVGLGIDREDADEKTVMAKTWIQSMED